MSTPENDPKDSYADAIAATAIIAIAVTALAIWLSSMPA